MSESKELLPCPFCGGEATLYSWRDCDFTTHHHIGCKCGITFEYNDVVSDLIEAWNKRVDRVSNYCETCGAKMSKSAYWLEASIMEYFICSRCGHIVRERDGESMEHCPNCNSKMSWESEQ